MLLCYYAIMLLCYYVILETYDKNISACEYPFSIINFLYSSLCNALYQLLNPDNSSSKQLTVYFVCSCLDSV